MTKAIEVTNLSKQFKIRTNKNIISGMFDPKFQIVEAVKDISFQVNEGESLAFLGPNGAGKTTTTKILGGLVHPTSGSAEVLGYTPSDRKKDFLMQIGLVMGNKSGLSWDLTAEQSFDFIRKIYCIEESSYKERLNKLTDLLQIEQHLNKQIRKLSLGERMKMELIGAILHNPKVLFLDEPTIGLDITSKKSVRKFLREIQRDSGITLILTSHDMDDVEKVCDRVIVINKGAKVCDDNLDTLVGRYNQKKFIKFFFENELTSANCEFAEILEQDSDSVLFEVSKENTSRLIAQILEHNSIIDLDIISVPLEEMIEDIFKKSSEVSSIAD
jgi:ABC-2 type transport system ATP-binding protein